MHSPLTQSQLVARGGSATSQHCKGQAIDIDDTFGRMTNAEMYHWIKQNLDSLEKAIVKFKSDDEKFSNEIEKYQKVVETSRELNEELMNERLDENEGMQKVKDEVDMIQEN